MGRIDIRLSGSGGQGIVTAGIILAHAAAVFDGKNAVQSQSYGPESRGGASKAEVIISDDLIDYPRAMAVDIFLFLSQEACDQYVKDLKDDGLLLTDAMTVKKIPSGKYRKVCLPMISTATRELGRTLVANIVAMGALVSLTQVVTFKSLMNAVSVRVPSGTEALNLKALESGRSLVEYYLKSCVAE